VQRNFAKFAQRLTGFIQSFILFCFLFNPQRLVFFFVLPNAIYNRRIRLIAGDPLGCRPYLLRLQ